LMLGAEINVVIRQGQPERNVPARGEPPPTSPGAESRS
jgi:hypothetical protein